MQIAILQTILPDYRCPVFETLRVELPGQVAIFAGGEGFDGASGSKAQETDWCQLAQNRFICGRRFLWQAGVADSVLASDLAIVELNPRILSTWVLLYRRARKRKPTIVWGHASSRKGRDSATNLLRRRMVRLATAVISYTEDEARIFASSVGASKVFAAHNALYSSRTHSDPVADAPGCVFLFVGRLVDQKRPGLALRAFASAKDALPSDAALVFVGDGPLRARLEAEARVLGVGRSVRFTGHVGRFTELRSYYNAALASVSPGYVGLSLTQSLWFGVPMLIADSEPHSPEIEAARKGLNCLFFRAGDVSSLAAAMVEIAASRSQWVARRSAIAKDCRSRYSLENMTAGIAAAVDYCLSGPAC